MYKRQQCARSRITSPAEIFGETLNDPGDSAPLQPRCGALQVLAFSKTKITFEREEISDHQWDWGKYNEAVDGNWENCVRSQCAYLEGDWGIIVLCTMFLVPCIFFNNVSIFHSTWLDTFWTDLIYRFQVYNSIIHHMYIVLCAHDPKSSLLPSLFLMPLPSYFRHPPFPLVITILLFMSMSFFPKKSWTFNFLIEWASITTISTQ